MNYNISKYEKKLQKLLSQFKIAESVRAYLYLKQHPELLDEPSYYATFAVAKESTFAYISELTQISDLEALEKISNCVSTIIYLCNSAESTEGYADSAIRVKSLLKNKE